MVVVAASDSTTAATATAGTATTTTADTNADANATTTAAAATAGLRVVVGTSSFGSTGGRAASFDSTGDGASSPDSFARQRSRLESAESQHGSPLLSGPGGGPAHHSLSVGGGRRPRRESTRVTRREKEGVWGALEGAADLSLAGFAPPALGSSGNSSNVDSEGSPPLSAASVAKDGATTGVTTTTVADGRNGPMSAAQNAGAGAGGVGGIAGTGNPRSLLSSQLSSQLLPRHIEGLALERRPPPLQSQMSWSPVHFRQHAKPATTAIPMSPGLDPSYLLEGGEVGPAGAGAGAATGAGAGAEGSIALTASGHVRPRRLSAQFTRGFGGGLTALAVLGLADLEGVSAPHSAPHTLHGSGAGATAASASVAVIPGSLAAGAGSAGSAAASTAAANAATSVAGANVAPVRPGDAMVLVGPARAGEQGVRGAVGASAGTGAAASRPGRDLAPGRAFLGSPLFWAMAVAIVVLLVLVIVAFAV